ncbi:MAG TPA: FAD-binding oxidoreductase [Candidatus Sulfotelmatobacter sp.]|nr:FAD-binding oxidoreductase [Candidatus Sulfotelmatobacter sp.]
MMKWWGWGSEGVEFPMQHKPNLWPWICQELGIPPDARPTRPVPRSAIVLDKPVIHQGFLAAVEKALGPGRIARGEDERLLHAYGKSYPDLLRVRRGQVDRAPDVVILPEGHADVEAVVFEAQRHNVCVIPFGGGTNIVGGVNPVDRSGRMVVSLDLRDMARVLAVDEQSQTATIEAGALGPTLEQELQRRGWSLGHHPDSFEFSSLGGWLATRSAGMQSDAYGKIEDMVVALRMVTPLGTLTTRPAPRAATGPDLNQVAVGSEGVLGVITEATMRVHRNPPVRSYHGFLFPTFEAGHAAIYECVTGGFPPSLFRLSDARETELAFQMKSPDAGLKRLVTRAFKRYLAGRGYGAPCLMITGFEGDPAAVAALRAGAFRILKRHQGFHLGTKVGDSWSREKYNLPYLRDYVMDYGVMADVAETSTVWSNLLPLYHGAKKTLEDRFRADGKGFYLGCHISHTYKTGASLYFTFAAHMTPGKELEEYYRYKRLVTETFVTHGGTLSHHHAVGIEHQDWFEREVTPTGVRALRGLKAGLDPQGIMNPGKLIPPGD